MDTCNVIIAAGGYIKLARDLGLHRATVFGWKTAIPVRHVPRVSDLTGIPRHVICPNLWESPGKDQSTLKSPT